MGWRTGSPRSVACCASIARPAPEPGWRQISRASDLRSATPLRVAIADDAVLLREGLRGLLTEAGFDVVGVAGDATELIQIVSTLRPDVVLADIRMPPTQTTEGLQAACDIRRGLARHRRCGPLPARRNRAPVRAARR